MNGHENEVASHDAMMYLIHHVFLPPKLPQEDDFSSKRQGLLIDVVLDSLSAFGQSGIVDKVKGAIDNIRLIHGIEDGTISEGELGKALSGLEEQGHPIPLHVRAQNAGLLISRVDDSIHFEIFELSPLNKAVYSTRGRLRRTFPGAAVSLDLRDFQQDGCQETIAKTLAKMSSQAAAGMQPQARKAGRDHDEDRDTTHPAMVSELFLGFLRAFGEEVDVPVILKHTREEVMWSDSRSPWRRSPMWLLIRVTLQLVFSRSATGSRDVYKEFMVVLMGNVLKLSQHRPSSISSDLCFAMNAKLARRLQKAPNLDKTIVASVQKIMQGANNALREQWLAIQKHESHTLDPLQLSSLDFSNDTLMALPALDEWIKALAARQARARTAAFQPQSHLIDLQNEELPTFVGLDNECVTQNLQAFESWVASNLLRWMGAHKGNASTCGQLGNLIRHYFSCASQHYSGNPEGISLMLLTILELWIACDESGTHRYPLLAKYDPGVPSDFLQSLLLPLKEQMERLRLIEDYLLRRKSSACLPTSGLFQAPDSTDSFAARQFDQSTTHQRLLQTITAVANKARQEKIAELHQLKAEYSRLMELHARAQCDTDESRDSWGITTSIHRPGCERCRNRTKAENMTVTVHEWPLPTNKAKEKSVVYELELPSSFACWRDSTIHLILNVLRGEYYAVETPRARYPLSTDKQFVSARVFTSSETPWSKRVTLLSQDKPHLGTHRNGIPVSTATEQAVCLASGLNYQYFDDALGQFIHGIKFKESNNDIAHSCTYTLNFQALQKFIFRPAGIPDGPASNMVVASQSECPDSMTLGEYKALAAIPLGVRIQWQNILVQLAAPSINFKKIDTALVILQCTYQAGESGKNGEKESHALTYDFVFARSLLQQLEEALDRIKENWDSSLALNLYASIARRLLSVNPSTEIQRRCLKYLGATRLIAFGWVGVLREKAQHATKDIDRTEYLSRAVEVAFACVDTYNVNDEHFAMILRVPLENASILFQCSIYIQESRQIIKRSSDSMLNSCNMHIGPDDAIKKSWSAYRPGAGWNPVSPSCNHWLTTTTGVADSSYTLHVHYNLLDGELLVNGLPLDRLPIAYEEHASYQMLFGRSAIEVMPTPVAGMQFSARRTYSGFNVNFGMDARTDSWGCKSNELLIQATRDGDSYELVPSRFFQDEFPDYFFGQFVHWYDSKNRVVEFRTVEDCWDPLSAAKWTLQPRKDDASKWQLVKDESSLLGMKSKTAEVVSRVFSPLIREPFIHIILTPSRVVVEVTIPSLQLGFFLKIGESSLRSWEYRDMFVDADQSLGTLIGFSNKLLLKHEHNDDRIVLLLDGPVSHEAKGDHIGVFITKSSAVGTHSYHVDESLGRLIDNGSLRSKLFVAYLHALTSFCLPDPFTYMTGTEKALDILRSAAVRSFDQLAQNNIDTLEEISQLTPTRKYYPKNERVMQQINWCSGISFLSQHGLFRSSVRAIFDQAKQTSILYPDNTAQVPDLSESSPDLLERDCIRSSMFRIFGFGGELHTPEHDTSYQARDRDHASTKFQNAFVMSDFVHRRRTSLHWSMPDDIASHLWNALSKSQVHGPSRDINISISTRYDARLLQQPFSTFAYPAWIALQRRFSQMNKVAAMAWLSTVACAGSVDTTVLQTVALFYTLGSLSHISAPQIDSFRLSNGYKPIKQQLRQVVEANILGIRNAPEMSMPQLPRETATDLGYRRQRAYNTNRDKSIKSLVDAINAQWPCETPTTPVLGQLGNVAAYIDVNKVINGLKPKFKLWSDNLRFFQYLQQIAGTISPLLTQPAAIPGRALMAPSTGAARARAYISDDDLFAAKWPSLPVAGFADVSRDLLRTNNNRKSKSKTNPQLVEMIKHLETTTHAQRHEEAYVKDLESSLQSLKAWKKDHVVESYSQELLQDYWQNCKDYTDEVYNTLISALSTSATSIAEDVSQWPRVSPMFLLQQLSRLRWSKLPHGWKACIVQYGGALAMLQRADRLVKIARTGSTEDLKKELFNTGHTNWKPLEFPDSLLLEVESGIMIRENQEQIAHRMRASETNVVMQLNMGEGKSSLIVPIVVAALADGSQMVRVVVAKPQSKQMAQMLVSKLGGSLNRRVYYMPFSRSLKLTASDALAIDEMCRECKKSGGVMLLQPEHMLSFQLMGLESFIANNDAISKSLLQTRDFLDESSRDIVDESDENFSVKFELLYCIGAQQPIDLSPARWLCIHQVLELIRNLAPATQAALPSSLELNNRLPGRFPRTRFLKPDAQDHLLGQVAEHICQTGLDGFPIARQQPHVRQSVLAYMTMYGLKQSQIDEVEKSLFWTASTKDLLLLLRGLFAGGVLGFAFSHKRWRVNYGLTDRVPATKLAVPYRAKDMPSPRSEFSQPDVVIVLTSLSFYYGGLDDASLFAAFDHLIKADQADIKYQAWVKDAPTLSLTFTQLEGINLKDKIQCVEKVFPELKYAKGAIDYFLSHIVFPKEVNEYPNKLSASGWDIGKIKTHPTTGFSGTNDAQAVLPIHVEHLDLPEQNHTNALVLDHLLQPENSVSHIPKAPASPDADASVTDAERLLRLVMNLEPQVQVILDVGAQILELGNVKVAARWLQLHPDDHVQAAIYVNDNDELSVIDRKGRIELLQTSSYAVQLDVCLVFLDEAHTRGIDLKLPEHYRAAVTLGAILTKDRMVQACMRMRKLGKGQTIVFCVPEEINAKILELTSPRANNKISVSDIIRWTISETGADTRRSMPLWAVQGQRFIKHNALWGELHQVGATDLSEEKAKMFLEKEAQTLEDRYRPSAGTSTDLPSVHGSSQDSDLDRIVERCGRFENLNFKSSILQEEQERELAPEIEQERQIQRPPAAEPAQHSLHAHLIKFVETGLLIAGSDAYMAAFDSLHDISAANYFDISQLHRKGTNLLVTTDFATTVKKTGSSYQSDSYQRPVQWILTSSSTRSDVVQHMIVISPHEANELLPHVQRPRAQASHHVALHVYTPRWNLRHKNLDRLDFFTVPTKPTPPKVPDNLRIQLNLFAGQLYFDSFKDYLRVCQFLGLATTSAQKGWSVAADGFVLHDDCGRVGAGSGVRVSPVKFLTALMTKVRRDGEGISKTHVGMMLEGSLLESSDFK